MNIVIATDDRYFCAAENLVNSLRRLHKSNQTLTVYVLKSKSTREFLGLSLKSSPFFEVRLIDVPEDCDIYRMYTSVHITNMSYIKLFLDLLLPASVDKVLYLDCDVALVSFPTELFSIDLDAAPVAAVQDFLLTERTGVLLGTKTDECPKYFNAGVLLFDLATVRRLNYLERARQLAILKNYDLHDQDALNEVFAGNWCVLPREWNFQIGFFDPRTTRPDLEKQRELCLNLDSVRIIHYTGKFKPWSRLDPSIGSSAYRCWHFGFTWPFLSALLRDLKVVASIWRVMGICFRTQLRLLAVLLTRTLKVPPSKLEAGRAGALIEILP